MPRKRLPPGEKKLPLTIMIEGKYIENENIQDIQDTAYLSIIKYVKAKQKINK